jgi:hypothetical protein
MKLFSSSLCTFVMSAACLIAANAGAVDVVVPAAQASASGNGQSTSPLRNYGSGGSRFQQLHDASTLAGFVGPHTISSISFRARQSPLLSFIGNRVSVSDIRVQLSTTSRVSDTTAVNGLSGQFADNIGSDVVTVYSGQLTLMTAFTGSPTPAPFDYTINFQTPFTYDPAEGNLLVDFLIPDSATVSGNGSIGFAQFDTFTDAFPSADGLASAAGGTGSATIGANSTRGIVIKFRGEPAGCGCAADYNQDGGIDGSDVNTFFADWSAAEGCADINQDGGIDGSDVDTFFQIWVSGGC